MTTTLLAPTESQIQRLGGYGGTLESPRDLHGGRKEKPLGEAVMGMHHIFEEGVPICWDTIFCLLGICTKKKDLAAGRRLHSLLARNGLDSIAFWGDHLVRLFTSCGSLSEANRTFSEVSKPTLYTWNAIISAHAKLGDGKTSFELYYRMQQAGIRPDRVTFLSMLKACSSLEHTSQGRLIHDHIIKRGLGSDVLIGSALVHMYATRRSLDEAYRLFSKLPDRDIVSWGAMIAGYVQEGHGLSALELFEKMQEEGLEPDRVTCLSTLKACSILGAIGAGRSLHDKVVTGGFESNLAIGNTLVDMYAKCGSLEEACKVFNGLHNRDAVSWSAIIAGYGEHGNCLHALELFERMEEEGSKPSKVTFLWTLKACSNVGALAQGRLIHEQIIRRGLQSDMEVGNAIVDMYAKCGIPDEAFKVFIQSAKKDLVSWGAVIAGYAQAGSCRKVTQFLEDMRQGGLKPNDVIFTSILAACSHAGLVDEGQRYFESMSVDYGIQPAIEHYSCMIDLLGRTGCLKEAEHFLEIMPLPPDLIVWKSLLTSCRTHGNIELGRRCFVQVVQWDPTDATGYILMSSLYADAHMWEDVIKVHEIRRNAGAWKKPGKAWIEVNKKVHDFLMGGKCHEESGKIHAKLQRLGNILKEGGHVLHLDVIFESMLEDMPDALCGS